MRWQFLISDNKNEYRARPSVFNTHTFLKSSDRDMTAVVKGKRKAIGKNWKHLFWILIQFFSNSKFECQTHESCCTYILRYSICILRLEFVRAVVGTHTQYLITYLLVNNVIFNHKIDVFVSHSLHTVIVS